MYELLSVYFHIYQRKENATDQPTLFAYNFTQFYCGILDIMPIQEFQAYTFILFHLKRQSIFFTKSYSNRTND